MQDDQRLGPGASFSCDGTGDDHAWTDDEHGVLVEPAEPPFGGSGPPRDGGRRFYEF